MKPTVQDLYAAAERIRRGERHPHGAKWPVEMPVPYVDPCSLRPGVDVVQLIGDSYDYLWLGFFRGRAAVRRLGTKLGKLVRPELVNERNALICPSVDPYDFMEGWGLGRWSVIAEKEISDESKLRKPTAYGRGLVKGYQDVELGRPHRPMSWIPYNEEVRRLVRLYPNEHRIVERRVHG